MWEFQMTWQEVSLRLFEIRQKNSTAIIAVLYLRPARISILGYWQLLWSPFQYISLKGVQRDKKKFQQLKEPPVGLNLENSELLIQRSPTELFLHLLGS